MTALLESSIRELAEMFDGYVDSNFIYYPPEQGWQLTISEYSDELEYCEDIPYTEQTLYQCMRELWPMLNCSVQGVPYPLFEACVTTGNSCGVITYNRCGEYVLNKDSYSTFSIQFSGPLGPNKYQYCGADPTVEAMTLNCIAMMIRIADKGDVDALEKVTGFLQRRLNSSQHTGNQSRD